ncbi:hypothetical protein [Phenylobacterium sp.]|uniref:hypothetical protein n=1 Tax=Phenylobacterium sp. TaxID=1871053 RepID=UPI00122BC676|nr:hypothetical protein [Phenylobacterium sp.]THD62289.1 MAG: hypothetical protein E8A49_08490 [Phenylobacterium sp.]
MSNDQDYCERTLDAPDRLSVERIERARGPGALSWWIAATVAVAAVIGAAVLLNTARPSPETLQAAHDRRVAESQIDETAYGSALTAAHSAEAEARARAHDSEPAPQFAANADGSAQGAAANASAPAD